MPLLKIVSNRPVAAAEQQPLLKELSETVAQLLHKPESYVLIVLEYNAQMLFGGSDAPLAYLEFKSIGLPEAETADLSGTLCKLLETKMAIPGDRIYIEFSDIQRNMWGWNGRTFA